MSLYQIIQSIADAKGINAKKSIVSESVDKDKILTFMRNVLNPQISIYQSGIEVMGPMQTMVASKTFKKYMEETGRTGITAAIQYTLGTIPTGGTRGNGGKTLISAVHSVLNEEDKRLYEMFIQRDLKCGLGIKSINTIQPDTIPYSPYQRSEGAKPQYYEKLNWAAGVYSQLKADGMFFNGDVEMEIASLIGDTTITSREGRILKSAALADVKRELSELADHWSIIGGEMAVGTSPIFHGELLVVEVSTGKVLPREEGNGMLNSIIQTGADIPEGYTIRAKVWDVITREMFSMNLSKKEASGLTYKERFEVLTDCFAQACPQSIDLIESRVVYSFEEASAHFQEMLDRGEEGTIIKDADMQWYDGTSQQSLKLKMVMSTDLVIVALNEGDQSGKHANTFGSIECESSCGKLSVGVHGLSDSLRQEIFDNFETVWKGSILPVDSNGIIKNRDDETKMSLFLPRVGGERRLDKHEADSLERIYEIQEATIKNGGKTPAGM